MPPPLTGLRVLDLSRQLPGPFCSTLLADLGADVLLVTAPGDPFGVGIPFLARNKRSLILDLKCAAGREVFGRLVARADVLLEGFRPGVTARLGIDYPTLRARNPRLVYCSITGYGQDGPYRDRVARPSFRACRSPTWAAARSWRSAASSPRCSPASAPARDSTSTSPCSTAPSPGTPTSCCSPSSGRGRRRAARRR